MPAWELEPDTDLGARLVTADVGALTLEEVGRALARGAGEAERMRSDGLIATAVLCLEDQVELVAPPMLTPVLPRRGDAA